MSLAGETIADGAAPRCEDCGKMPHLAVSESSAGFYIGTYCHCGPYTRESGYYPGRKEAQAALECSGYHRHASESTPAWLVGGSQHSEAKVEKVNRARPARIESAQGAPLSDVRDRVDAVGGLRRRVGPRFRSSPSGKVP